MFWNKAFFVENFRIQLNTKEYVDQ